MVDANFPWPNRLDHLTQWPLAMEIEEWRDDFEVQLTPVERELR